MREFELLGANEDKPNPLLLDRLRACCAVINAVGPKARPCRAPRPAARKAYRSVKSRRGACL